MPDTERKKVIFLLKLHF